MSQQTTVYTSRHRAWLISLLRVTKEQRGVSMWKRLMRKMANINPRSYTSAGHVGRNDSCPCGKVYPGIWLRDKFGSKIPDVANEGSYLEMPVKYKHCCMGKYTGLRPGEVTPAMAEAQKKQKVYFKKYGKVIA